MSDTEKPGAFGEPWKQDDYGHTLDADGAVTAALNPVDIDDHDFLCTRAARAVACVNALAGVADPGAVRFDAERYRAICAQLWTVVQPDGGDDVTTIVIEEIKRLRAENASLRERGERMVELPELNPNEQVRIARAPHGLEAYVVSFVDLTFGMPGANIAHVIEATPAAALRALSAKLKGANDADR